LLKRSGLPELRCPEQVALSATQLNYVVEHI
jgi:hypothetical protein